MGTDSGKDIVEELSGLPINHFIHAVEEARKNQHAKLDRFVADMVADDIQKHIDATDWKAPAPSAAAPSSAGTGTGARYSATYAASAASSTRACRAPSWRRPVTRGRCGSRSSRGC